MGFLYRNAGGRFTRGGCEGHQAGWATTRGLVYNLFAGFGFWWGYVWVRVRFLCEFRDLTEVFDFRLECWVLVEGVLFCLEVGVLSWGVAWGC